MKKPKRISLLGALTIIIVILFVIAIAIPTLNVFRRISTKFVCGTNLKGLGTAMVVYANDYNDNFPQLPGTGPWSRELGFPYYLENPDFEKAQLSTPRSVTASLYLLVRECDVSPKSFICPFSDQLEFTGDNPDNSDITKLWDFGYDPQRHVSYAYHNPYGQYPPDGSRSASFVIAADMNPWFYNGSLVVPGRDNFAPQIINVSREETWKLGNSSHHKSDNIGIGQNVLFTDGHTAFEKQSNVGVKHDNIYTYWSTEEKPTDQDKQGGTAPTGRSAENDAKSPEDSFLVL